MTSNVLISFSERPYHQGPPVDYQSSTSYFDPVVTYPKDVTYPKELAKDIQLEVSGASFVLNSRDFQKLAALPWVRIQAAAYRLDSASPEAFVTCLENVLSSTLPKRKKMNPDLKDEVASMAKTLGLVELAEHMTSKRGCTRSSKIGSLFFCSRARTSDVKQA